ncbi:unnamed protein product [Polarella glacialis]|uniref:Fe2OG dioxygenase domain-containing protein n=1 Tax=Polarella glacialis TaxID=89957 RepID=A0A813DEK8_POLGL|nr:unnamed protein product [Polarella glacialis]CAE8654384.1 unnamed protein product [Polarella glacialis]
MCQASGSFALLLSSPLRTVQLLVLFPSLLHDCRAALPCEIRAEQEQARWMGTASSGKDATEGFERRFFELALLGSNFAEPCRAENASRGSLPLVEILRDSQSWAAERMAADLQRRGHAVLLGSRAAELALPLLRAQAAACPRGAALEEHVARAGTSFFGNSKSTFQTNALDTERFSFPACLDQTQEVARSLAALHATMWATSQLLLRVLAKVQQRTESDSKEASWLGAALAVGEPGKPSAAEWSIRQRRQVLLRSMSYYGPNWGGGNAHQDGSWLTLIVSDRRGLQSRLPESAGASDWTEADLGSEGAEGLAPIVLVGGNLDLASGSFYPASCHKVDGISDASVRFSWVMLYTSNCCLFNEHWDLNHCGFDGHKQKQRKLPGQYFRHHCIDSDQGSCKMGNTSWSF